MLARNKGVANWISQFLLTYHQYDPQTVGATTVSWFLGPDDRRRSYRTGALEIC